MIQTARLILRPPQITDKAAVRAQLSNLKISRMLAKVPHPYPAGLEDAWWSRVLERRALGYPAYFMMEIKGGDGGSPNSSAVGSIAIGPTDAGAWRMGYWLDEPYWGKGLMSEAVAGVIDYTAKTWAPEALVSGVFHDNPASRRILERLGFAYVDTSQEWCEARRQTLAHVNLRLEF